MVHLAEMSVEQLQQALDDVDGKKPTQRLMVAIAYKNGISQTELADWYGVRRRTIYNWLTRLEAEPPETAVYDDRRSGRPRKLSDEQRAKLEETLRDSPKAVGFEAAAWTPALVQEYLDDAFDVEYSRPSCRRLMREAGLRYEQPHREAADTSSTGHEDSDDEGSAGRWVPQ